MAHLSEDPKERVSEEKCLADITQFGLHILLVHGDDEWPEFAYTVGLFHSYGHPEVIVLGLPSQQAQSLLNYLAGLVREGQRFAAGAIRDDVLSEHACTFRLVPADQVRAHFGWARWFYEGKAFPTLQLVWPDREGRWPWDEHVDPGFRAAQPVLADSRPPSWSQE